MRGCGRIGRPAFPAPSDFKGGWFLQKLGRIAPRGRGVLFWKLGQRHCEEPSDEAIQFSMPRYGLLRFARNDGFETRYTLTRHRPRRRTTQYSRDARESSIEVAAYWIVRSSRTTTVVWKATKQSSTSSARMRQDPASRPKGGRKQIWRKHRNVHPHGEERIFARLEP